VCLRSNWTTYKSWYGEVMATEERSIGLRAGSFLAIAACALARVAQAGPIEDLQPGNWLEISGTHMRAVLPSPVPTGNPYQIMAAWSGGAYDTSRNRLLVWGGGHNDYCGNELYAFDVPTMQWIRLTDPSSTPVIVHSYDQLEYLPDQDGFFATGGSTCSPGGNATSDSWMFSFSSNTWVKKASIPGSLGSIWELSMDSDYDPVSKKFILYGYSQSADYDPAADKWTAHGNNYSRDLRHTGALDPVHRKYVTIGNGTAYVFDVDSTGKLGAQKPLNSNGSNEIEGVGAPGLVWDPKVGKLVAWGTGGDVYALDMSTVTWTRYPAKNSVNPGDPYNNNGEDYGGTLGRWRYMPAYNAYIVVTHIDHDVFIYKLSDGAGVVSPTVNFAASPTTIAANGSSTLSWSTSNADACTASGGWTGAKGLSGSSSTGALSANATYSLTCTNAGGGSTTRTVTVSIASAAVPTVNLTATPTTVTSGGMSTINWSSTNATSCTATGGLGSWAGAKATSGSAVMGPFSVSATFGLSCTNANGSNSASVVVSVGSSGATPTVSISSSSPSVASGSTVMLTWSSTNSSGCTASGAWAGNKAASGSEQSPTLNATSTFNLQCNGSGGTAINSATVTVTGGASSPTPQAQKSGGGGAFGMGFLLMLVGMFAKKMRGLIPHMYSLRKIAPKVGVLLGVLGLAQATQAATRDEDWIARSTAPGVVRAMGFDTQSDYANGLWDQGRDNAWDSSVKSSGAGSLRFDIKSQTGEGAAGSWTMNFSQDLTVQFGANDEFWVQWRQKFDPYVIDHFYKHTDGNGEWKQLILAQGDTPKVVANTCTENELVVQNESDRKYPSVYIECGPYDEFATYLGGSLITHQNQRVSSTGTSTCLWWPIGSDTSGCVFYVANEWMTFMLHVKMGPDGVANSSVSSDNPKKGFINSTVEFYVGRDGQPLQLVHRQDNLVIPRGQHWNPATGIDPDNNNDPGYTGGWTPQDGHPYAKYGKVWLLPYNTMKDATEVTQNASIWYDELIISRQRIADPMAAPGSSPPTPTVTLSASSTSIQSGGSVTLTWSSDANTCMASGGWSGTKGLVGSQSVGPLTATTTYVLTCTTTAGVSGQSQATITVAGSPASSAPTVAFNAAATTVASGASTTLTWSATNATSCAGSNGMGAWAGTKALSGNANVGPFTTGTTFTLACTGSGGTTSQNVVIAVSAPATGDPTPTPTGSQKSGGGGAIDFLSVFLFSALLGWSRRRSRCAV
jgi:hypothetical protein